MKNKALLSLAVALLVFALPSFAQVALKTGSIYGKIADDKGVPLPGVGITLESDRIPAQTATAGPSGGFRYANLPPGEYSIQFALDGYTELRQENIQVSVGAQVQLEITLKASLSEEFTVSAETPVVDTSKTGNRENFDRKYLDGVPSARDPWSIIDQTTGIDSDRYNVAGSESGLQSYMLARGDGFWNNIYNYDGVNITDPGPGDIGGSPTYYDFNAFEEMSISTGGSDVSVQTGGVVINIVTRRGGNRWAANGSFYFANQSLQADNTPQELKDMGAMSNRLDELNDYGFDIGGPVVKDRLFAWGAFHKNDIGIFTIQNLPSQARFTEYNFKANMNWNRTNESQFGYFNSEKARHAVGEPTQAPEALSDQRLFPRIWTGQHTWITNENTIVTGRYGYVDENVWWVPAGGMDRPMIYLAAIPRYESTFYVNNPVDRSSHDLTVDVNHYRDRMLGGDHEFKFGFEYRTSSLHSFTSYGNGVLIYESTQTIPEGPLISGYVYAHQPADARVKSDRASFYAADTYRKNRLTLNLGVRFDSATGRNEASAIPGVPGFEQYVDPFNFPGNDPGIRFNDWSPRIGATYDLTGDGKTVVRGSFARYYDSWLLQQIHVNPTYGGSGVYFSYTNRNGDRTITPDELTSGPNYLGSLGPGGFNLEEYLAKFQIDPDLTNEYNNEYIAGFERQVGKDVSVAVQYTHRSYHNWWTVVPAGITPADYLPAANFTASTVFGDFNVPFYNLPTDFWERTFVTRNLDGYVQTYDGVDITARKRMSRDFMLNAGLTLQRQKGHFNSPDAAGFTIDSGIGIYGSVYPFDPGQAAMLDNQPYGYAGGRVGVYPYSEWHFRISGVYQLPRDFSVGAFARYRQGYPFVLFARADESDSYRLILVEPFASRRYDNVFTLDLQAEKGFDFKGHGRFSLTAALLNATNANTVLRRNLEVTAASLNNIEEVISPRALRIGARYSY